MEAGKRDEAMDLYRQALAVAEKLVAEQPHNPDFRYQRAMCNQSIATVSAYRKAEAELAELRGQFPDRLVYRRELVRSRWNLAYTIFQHSDRPGGIAMVRLAVEEGDALLAASGASDDDKDVAAYAYHCLGWFLSLTGRFQEAIAEERKALAIEEPVVARHPENKTYLANYAFMCTAAANYYYTSRNWTSVLEYGSKALRYLDAKQVVASGDSEQIAGLTTRFTISDWPIPNKATIRMRSKASGAARKFRRSLPRSIPPTPPARSPTSALCSISPRTGQRGRPSRRP